MPAPIALEEAIRAVLAEVHPLPAESLAVEQTLGRVLAEDVVASGSSPPFDSSAMDGYAITSGPAGRTLPVTGESRAGAPAPSRLPDGGAMRISTGAAIPPGADAVIRQEDARGDAAAIVTMVDTPAGDNVRRAGEDLEAGARVLASGTAISPGALALAVGAGRAELAVARRPRVTVLVSGDELRDAGKPLGPGQIHDSNGPMLRAMALRSGALLSAYPPRIPDRADLTRAALAAGLEGTDVLIVSGGVSVGPHDHVKRALAELGVEQRFWRVALRPGGPTWFGVRGRQLVFALPGNPVSAAVTFALFARPALAGLQGLRTQPPFPAQARLTEAVKPHPSRTHAIRVSLVDSDGRILATPTGPQGSHITRSLLAADALALIPPGRHPLPAGAPVRLEAAPG